MAASLVAECVSHWLPCNAGTSGVWTVHSQKQFAVESILSIDEGCQHPVWGMHFAKSFGRTFEPQVNRQHQRHSGSTNAIQDNKDVNSKAVNKSKVVDLIDSDEEDCSELECAVRKVAWYHPGRLCK